MRLGSFIVVTSLCLAAGCHDPWSTGPYGMRGQLVDSVDQPIPLKKVYSEEHGDMTESDGRFVVRWKDPATFVDVRVDGVTYRRRWQPGDPAEVKIRIPETQPGKITCRSDVECVAEVHWDLGDGFSARLDVECGDTASIRVQGLPPGAPSSVTCPSVLGDRPMEVSRTGSELHIDGKPLPLPLTIDGPEQGADCSVEILDGTLERGQGTWALQPRSDTWAWAVCDGRSGTPVAVSRRQTGVRDRDARVVLPWSAAGPDLTLPMQIPEPRAMTFVRRQDAKSAGWKMTIPPREGQTYALPPLPPGQYLMGLGSPTLFATTNPPEPEVPGQVYLLHEGEVWGEDRGMVGALSIEEALTEGAVEVIVQDAP